MPARELKYQRIFALFVAIALLFGVLPHDGFAQSTTDNLTEKLTNQRELEQVNQNLQKAKARQQEMRQEIDALDKDIGAINEALITTTSRSQKLETGVRIAEEELAVALDEQNTSLKKLNNKRALLGELLGALQRMGRNPPPAVLVRPEDALSSVRSAILLGAIVPEIRTETQTLMTELKTLKAATTEVQTRKVIFTQKLDELSEDESRLTLLIEEKNLLTRLSKEEFQKQQDEIEKLSTQATSLQDLIVLLETRIDAAARAVKSAKQADARRKSTEARRLKAAKLRLETTIGVNGDTTRIEPAVAFSAARGTLLWPVSGIKIYNFGSKTSGSTGSANVLGSKTQNIALQTRPNARVRAPADSWVVYAGPFRSFGHLLILNAGEGYYIVLSGLNQINVEVGRFVLAGEPVGQMGTKGQSTVSGTNFSSKSPVLYVEFRKDGKSIDPAPWWDPRTKTLAQAGNG